MTAKGIENPIMQTVSFIDLRKITIPRISIAKCCNDRNCYLYHLTFMPIRKEYMKHVFVRIKAGYRICLSASCNYDVPPIIVGNRTLTPVRAIGECLGATVNWDAATQTVTIDIPANVEQTITDEMIDALNFYNTAFRA